MGMKRKQALPQQSKSLLIIKDGAQTSGTDEKERHNSVTGEKDRRNTEDGETVPGKRAKM